MEFCFIFLTLIVTWPRTALGRSVDQTYDSLLQSPIVYRKDEHIRSSTDQHRRSTSRLNAMNSYLEQPVGSQPWILYPEENAYNDVKSVEGRQGQIKQPLQVLGILIPAPGVLETLGPERVSQLSWPYLYHLLSRRGKKKHMSHATQDAFLHPTRMKHMESVIEERPLHVVKQDIVQRASRVSQYDDQMAKGLTDQGPVQSPIQHIVDIDLTRQQTASGPTIDVPQRGQDLTSSASYHSSTGFAGQLGLHRNGVLEGTAKFSVKETRCPAGPGRHVKLLHYLSFYLVDFCTRLTTSVHCSVLVGLTFALKMGIMCVPFALMINIRVHFPSKSKSNYRCLIKCATRDQILFQNAPISCIYC